MGTIANRQPTEEEINAAKMAGTFTQFGRIMTEAGAYSLLRQGIDDPAYRQALLNFHQDCIPAELGYQVLLNWLQENDLEKCLDGGSLEKQVKAWKIFYQKFYGKKFKLNRKKIFVDPSRLPAIKTGLEISAVNSVEVEATLAVLTSEDKELTEAEFFFYRILDQLRIKILERNGRARWTGKELVEVLSGYVPFVLEDFDTVAFRKDWVKECLRIIEKKGSAPKVTEGIVRISFVDNRQDIPADQKYVSQTGEIVEPKDCSFVSAVENNIRLVTPAQEILLAAKMFSDSEKYLARNTWEFNSALLEHDEKNPAVSVASARSCGGFFLDSGFAGASSGDGRWRLSL